MSDMAKPHIYHDAVMNGAIALLRSYPDAPSDPRPPQSARALFWLDDWDRGVTLARECCDRVIAAWRSLPDDLAFVRLAFGATDEQVEAMELCERDAWEALAEMVQNIIDTSDPTTPHGSEYDAETDADEVVEG